MALLLSLLLFLLVPHASRAFNHWVVTEEGKIEYQVASPFNLRQPFDLMALIQQEERVSVIKELREELIDYKNEFESYTVHENFDESFRALDPDCQNIQLISSYDLYIGTVLPLEQKGISYRDYLDLSSSVSPGEPFCTTTRLDFSMYALEHLEGIQMRRSLVAPPEKSVLSSVDDMRMDVFGSRVYHALEKNSTSWVLLDLATLYWRARGNPLNAVECIRRALHYSPEYAMDIALLNLANILHRSKHSLDATVPLHIAISLSPNVNVLHYTLGNIYAVLNQLNESVRCFKRCRQLNSDCETSRAMYRAALCELKMEEVSRERSGKLDETQKKLDQFYENIDLMRQNQFVISEEEELSVVKSTKKKSRKKSVEVEEPATNATPLTDPNLSQHQSKGRIDVTDASSAPSSSSSSERILEEALDAAIRNASVVNSDDAAAQFENIPDERGGEDDDLISEGQQGDTQRGVAGVTEVEDAERKDREREKVIKDVTDGNFVKQRSSSKVRLVLKPLTSEEEMEEGEGDRAKRGACPDRCGQECGKGRSSSVQDSCCEEEKHSSTSGSSLFSESSCKESQLPLPSSSPGEGGDIVSPSLTNLDVKETLSDLNEALECVSAREKEREKCQKMQQQFKKKKKTKQLKLKTITDEEEQQEKVAEQGEELEVGLVDEGEEKRMLHEGDELSMFNHVEIMSQNPRYVDQPAVSASTVVDAMKQLDASEILRAMNNPPPRDYPSMFHSLEFLPYNPVPERLDTILFPHKESLLPLYDDPYWPSKRECLSLLKEIKAKPNYVAFTGTFITPEARGADVGKLFASVPLDLPDYMQNPPRCTDIVELPYSMASLDHLEPIMYRNNFRTSLDHGEKGLKKVLIHIVTGELNMDFSFEESGQRAYAAMLKNGPNWVLFNIASLYWRVKGDPSNAIECLRRAIHYAPDPAADVGYLGLANVLHRVGYLNEAVIAVRAALDIHRESPVCHYTLASIYQSLRDYVASTVHLRAALHAQPSFSHALSALKMVRCSMKFKEEKAQLRKKMQEEEAKLLKEHEEQLLKDLKAAVQAEKEGKKIARQTKPAIVLENREPPEIPEFKIEDAIASPFTGEEAIWYMFRLSLFNQAKKTSSDDEKKKKEEKEEIDDSNGGSDGTVKDDVDDEVGMQGENEEGKSDSVKESEESQEMDRATSSSSSDTTSQDAQESKNKNIGSTKKSKSKKPSKKKQTSPPPVKTADNQPSFERDPEIDKILHEVVETINRNQTPIQRKLPSRVLPPTNREPIRAEDVRIRHSPRARPWPSMEECLERDLPKFLVFTSTWLSVTAKGVDVRKYMDFTSPLEHYPILPYCHNNFEPSRKTLEHLTGMNSHPLMQYKAEKGLQEVLCTLDGQRRSVDEMATRIKLSMDKNSTSWVLSNLAALYWRVVGQGQLAIKCLKHALYYSDEHNRDVALVSLSNVLYRSGFDKDATAVIHMSLEVCQRTSICESSPSMVVTHFTMANILAAQGFYLEAAGFYETTLNFQPEFKPAADRLKTVRCLMLMAKNQHLLEKEKRRAAAKAKQQ